MLTGYQLINTKTGDIVDQWGGVWGQTAGVPNPLVLPNGLQVCAAAPGQVFGEYQLLPWEISAPARSAVNDERDRRIFSGFVFQGVRFQSRLEDQKRIAGAGTLAVMAIVLGAKAGDYRWHGGDEDFSWIAEDNSLVKMDAQTVIAFGQAAANHESLHVFAARSLKELDPIPADFADDKYWPKEAVQEAEQEAK